MRGLIGWKVFAVLLSVGFLCATVVMFGLVALHQEIIEPSSIQIDQALQAEVHRFATPALTRVMFSFTWIGSPQLMFPMIAVAAAVLWWKRLRDDAVVLVLGTVGAAALDVALKLHFRRVRPDVPWALVHEHSYSFPSGHSVLAVALYGVVLYLTMAHLQRLPEKIAAVLAAMSLIFGIGASRVYLGVHYPSDVAGGYFVGAIWFSTVAGADWWVRRRTRAQ